MEPSSLADVTIQSELEQFGSEQLVQLRLRGVIREVVGVLVHGRGRRSAPGGDLRFLTGDCGKETGPL